MLGSDLSVVREVFVNLSKAFDCVSHRILLRKIDFRCALLFIHSYLKDRCQRVFFCGELSSGARMTRGVPYSHSGPASLFVIY